MKRKTNKALSVIRAELPEEIRQVLDQVDEFTLAYAYHILAARTLKTEHLKPQEFAALPEWFQLYIGKLARFYASNHVIPKYKDSQP